MTKHIPSLLAFVLSAFVVYFVVNKLKSNREPYPLYNEVQAIEREFFLYYAAHGKFPENKNFLSPVSQNIILAYPDQFTWDKDKVFLHFKDSSFGISKNIGEPDFVFEHNAKVWKVHGIWVDGGKEHYEASEEELKKGGVSLD